MSHPEDYQLTKIRRLAVASAWFSGLTLLGGLLFLGLREIPRIVQRGAQKQKLAGTHPPDAPILVSGGSLSFRADPGVWSCDAIPHTQCVTPRSVKTIAAEYLDGMPLKSDFTSVTVNNPSAWKFVIFPRDGTSLVDPGVSKIQIWVCRTSAASGGGAQCNSNGSNILVSAQGTGINGDPVKLVDSYASDDKVAELHTIQYYDKGCVVHSPTKVPTCEHPGYITFANGGSPVQYQCRHGNCSITFN